MQVVSRVAAALLPGVLLVGLMGASAMASTMVRHELLTQYSWDGKQGLYLEIANDQTKDDVIAPLKYASVSVGIADGSKWMSMSYSTPKWELGKDYAGRLIVKSGTPGGAELWVDGKKRGSAKLNYVPFDADPIFNGVPSWAAAPAAYKVLVKSLSVKTAGGNDYDAAVDPASYDASAGPLTIKDWRLADDDLDFTIDFTFSFAPAD